MDIVDDPEAFRGYNNIDSEMVSVQRQLINYYFFKDS